MTNMVTLDIDATYEGLTCREMIQLVRGRLGVGRDDTNRYTDADVVQALNMGQDRFAKLTSCLLYPVIIISKAGVQNYILPKGTLNVISARYYTSDSSTSYYELKILADPRAMQRLDSQYRGTAGDPNYLFPTYQFGNISMVGVSPIPTADANVLINDTDYGITTDISGYTIAGDISGTHKTGYPASAFLVDSLGRDLSVLGASPGFPVYNTTKVTSGLMTAIGNQDAINDKVTASLTGGGTWSEGDAYEILISNYGVNLDADSDHILVGTQNGIIADVVSGKGTIALDISKKPISLSVTVDTMICEIPASYQEAPISYAVYWLAQGVFKGVTQPQKAADALAIFNQLVAEFKLPDETVTETDSEIEDRSGEIY